MVRVSVSVGVRVGVKVRVRIRVRVGLDHALGTAEAGPAAVLRLPGIG